MVERIRLDNREYRYQDEDSSDENKLSEYDKAILKLKELQLNKDDED